MKQKTTFVEGKIPWFRQKAGHSSLKLTRETLEGDDFRVMTFTVHPYLQDRIPEEIFNKYQGQKISMVVDFNTESFQKACIRYFLGDSFLAPFPEKIKFLRLFLEYLFQNNNKDHEFTSDIYLWPDGFYRWEDDFNPDDIPSDLGDDFEVLKGGSYEWLLFVIKEGLIDEI